MSTDGLDIQALREHLAERDEPCPNCGYNLRGLSTGRCPECDQRLVLSVQLEEPRTGLMIGAIVGLMCGAAPHAALLAFVLGITLWHGRSSGPATAEAWFWYGLPALYAAMLGWLTWRLASRAGRRWFRRLSPSAAAWVAASGLGLSLVCHAVYVWIGSNYI